jgi:hypothetical protein
MSAISSKIVATAVGAVLAVTASEASAKYNKGPGARNVVGVWHCTVDYTVPLPAFQAVLKFSNDRNMSIIGSNDQDGLITDDAVLPAAYATSKTPAYGRWQPASRRTVEFSAIYYDTKGLLSGDESGVANNITRLNCKVRPKRFNMNGYCTADIYAPGGDPINGEPVLPGEDPIFTAECDFLTLR